MMTTPWQTHTKPAIDKSRKLYHRAHGHVCAALNATDIRVTTREIVLAARLYADANDELIIALINHPGNFVQLDSIGKPPGFSDEPGALNVIDIRNRK